MPDQKADQPRMMSAYAVLSNRDNAQVSGPYPRKDTAERERKRLDAEARELAPERVNRNDLEPLEPNTYRTEQIEIEEGSL